MNRNATPSSGRPAARPAASSAAPQLTQAMPRSAPLREAKDAALTSERPGQDGRRRITARRLDQIDASLSARDRHVLATVDRFHFLTGRQLRCLHYRDHASIDAAARAARRTLRRLQGLRVLGTLPRRVGGIHAGSGGLVYFVDVAGERLLRRADPARQRRRVMEPSARFVDHTLAVADLIVNLHRATDDASLAQLTDYQCEPAAWRRYPGLGGGTFVLKPDLYVETADSRDGDLVTAYFVEIDLGSESIPTLLRKCQAYERYRRSGSEQDAYGSFPRVLWALTDRSTPRAERRRDLLRTAISGHRDLPADLFVVSGPLEITSLITKGGTS